MSRSELEPDVDAVRTAFEGATSVLLLVPEGHASDVLCSALVTVGDPEDLCLLGITFDDDPDARIGIWRSVVPELPDEMAFITAGERTRSAVAVAPAGPGSTPVSIESIEDPADLTGLAMAISTYLDAWSETESTPVVCFFSLTDLLYHAERSRVFRFIHSTTTRLRGINAVSHYHLDPSIYDEGTINAFSSLFDAVVSVGDDGGLTIERRR